MDYCDVDIHPLKGIPIRLHFTGHHKIENVGEKKKKDIPLSEKDVFRHFRPMECLFLASSDMKCALGFGLQDFFNLLMPNDVITFNAMNNLASK